MIGRGIEPAASGLHSDPPRGHRIADRDWTNGRLHRISSTKYCHEKLGVAAAGQQYSLQ
jgi:hypothetical protein